jgi:hypothetical protein
MMVAEFKMLKKLLATVALIGALVAPTAILADTLPKQFLGNWCGPIDNETAGYVPTSKPCEPAEDVNSLTITPKELYYHATDGSTFGHCKIGSVSKYPKEVDAYTAHLTCGKQRLNSWFHLMDGKLFHKTFELEH